MLAARLWIDLKHLNMQSLGQRHQEAETHFQFLLYPVGQDHLSVLYLAAIEAICFALVLHFLLELGLFVC